MARKKVSKQIHVPMRTCIGCGKQSPKRELIRIVKTKEGDVFLDVTGKVRGRGANLCQDNKCFDIVLKGGKLERSLGLEKPLSSETKEILIKEFERALYEREFRQGREKVTLRVSQKELIDKEE